MAKPPAFTDDPAWSPEQRERATALREWMSQFFVEAMNQIIPKAIRYGSADLELMGKAMIQFRPELDGTVSGQELAVWFYVLGKVARLEGAYAQGEEPDIDSWYDLFVYALMAHRIRETGGW